MYEKTGKAIDFGEAHQPIGTAASIADQFRALAAVDRHMTAILQDVASLVNWLSGAITSEKGEANTRPSSPSTCLLDDFQILVDHQRRHVGTLEEMIHSLRLHLGAPPSDPKQDGNRSAG